ncbi:hypothetical protein FPOA_06784 [Fusarium poae]|uniref:RelA/SpoT domain-containing protein n=1 Tax=Fusarium poae TaxID=36050 RepID=A0A1B8AJC8_FUSPO|nr:hypothetical protein FPOA_06784 [Fusarium poae]
MDPSQSEGGSQKTTYSRLLDERHLAFQDVEPGGSPIEAFINAWPRLEPHYGTMVEQLKGALKDALRVRCTVSARVKSLSSIKKSIERRQSHRGEPYREVDEIFDDLHDLAGFRIVVDYPSGIGIAKAFITKNFQLDSTNVFKADREISDAWKPTFGSFQSENHHVLLHPDAKHPLSPFCGILFEIQVLSLAESLYNRLAHPLLYKRSSGELPVKDQKMIDVTHGLSLCYWICLSCMEDRLEGNTAETIPSSVQEVARLDGNQNVDMKPFVNVTPCSMPASREAVPIEKCLNSIKDLSTQAMSSDQLQDQLFVLFNAPIQNSTSNVNSVSGNILQNYGSGSNNTYSAGGNISIGENDIDKEIRDTFWVTDPQFHKANIEDRKGGLIDDSCGWILQDEQFAKWYEQDYSLLWLNGDPGKGKTMAVCAIINHICLLSKYDGGGPYTTLSYFFCDASDSTYNTATSVLRSIIHSIIFQDSTALSYVREQYKEVSKPLSDPRLAWPVLKSLLIGILCERRNRKVYLVIDALDECREDRDELLDFIVKQSSSLPVKWLVSSRKWPVIREILNACPKLLELNLEDNDTEVSAAVGFYITHQVETLSDFKCYDDTKREAVELYLRSKANSTFLWVSLVCQMLTKIPAWQTLKRLKSNSFPAGLDALYGRMLKQMQPPTGQERDLGLEAPDWVSVLQGVDDDWSPRIQTMEGHTADVRSIAFSHDGYLLASGSEDHTIKIWDVLTGTCLHSLLGHDDWVLKVAFSRTSYQLTSASSDHTIKIWDANNGVLIRTLAEHDGPVNDLVYGIKDSFLASGSEDGTIKLFDTIRGVCTRTIVIDGNPDVLSIAFTHDDQILSCCTHYSLLIWDLKDQTDPYQIQLKHYLSAHLISSHGNELFFIYGDHIEIWDPATKLRVRRIGYPAFGSFIQRSYPNSVILTKHGKLLGVTGYSAFRLFNRSMRGWEEEIREQAQDISVSPTSHVLAIASHSTVKLWDLSVPRHWKHLSKEADHLSVFSNHGSLLVTTSERDGELVVWRSCTGESIFKFKSHFGPTFSPDSQVLLMRRYDHNIYIKHLSQESGYEGIDMIQLPDEIGINMAVSHDSRWLAVSFRNRSISIWNVASKQFGSPIAKITFNSEHADPTEAADYVMKWETGLAVSFSHDSLSLAVYDGKHIKLYESSTWRCKSTIYNHDGNNGRQEYNLVFSSDDKFLATNLYTPISRVSNLIIWNLETMVCVRIEVPGHQFPIIGLDTSAVWRLEIGTGTYEIIGEAIHLVEPKYEVSEDLQWIYQGPERLLWLPPDFRPEDQHKVKIKFCKSCLKFKVTIVTLARRMVLLTLP